MSRRALIGQPPRPSTPIGRPRSITDPTTATFPISRVKPTATTRNAADDVGQSSPPTNATATVTPAATVTPPSKLSRVAVFLTEVVQWQRPFASALYLMLMNTVFWIVVFYARSDAQHTILLGLASALILLEVTQCVAGASDAWTVIRGRVSSAKLDYDTSKGWRTAKLFLYWTFTLAPLRFLLRPPVEYLWHVFGDKLDHVLIAVLSTTAAHFIEAEEREFACWAAYVTAAVIVVAPPWRFNKIGENLCEQVNASTHQSIEYTDEHLWQPTKEKSIHAATWVKYYALFEWLPLLTAFVHRTVVEPTVTRVRHTCTSIKEGVVHVVTKVCNFFVAIYQGIVALICGIVNTVLRIVYGVINAVRYTIHTFVSVVTKIYQWIRDSIVFIYTSIRYVIVTTYTTIRDAIVFTYETLRRWTVNTYNAVIYVIFGHWIPPLVAFCQRKVADAKHFAHEQWLLPIGVHLQNLQNAIIYVVCGHWLPGLGAHLHRTVVVPFNHQVDRAVGYSLQVWAKVKVVSAYIFYGIWARDLGRFLFRYSVIAGRWTHKEIVIPVWQETKLQSYNVAVWTKEAIVIPAYEGLCQAAHSFMLYIADTVLQPIVDSCIAAAKKFYEMLYVEVLTPAWLLLEIYAHRLKHQTKLHVIEPMCLWIESKMPYQDDRDMIDFMPATRSQGAPSLGDSDVDSFSLSQTSTMLKPSMPLDDSSATGFTPDQRHSYAVRTSSNISASDGDFALDEEEDPELGEFTRGMRFTHRAQVDSDSSDDEFSLRKVVRTKRSKPPKVRQIVPIPVDETTVTPTKIEVKASDDATIIKSSELQTTPTADNAAPSHSPSPEVDAPSWSETLLQAYRQKQTATVVKQNAKDNEFEVLQS